MKTSTIILGKKDYSRLLILMIILILFSFSIPHRVHAQAVNLLRIELMTVPPAFTESLYFIAIFSEPVSNAIQEVYYDDPDHPVPRFKLYSTAPEYTTEINSRADNGSFYSERWIISVKYSSPHPTADIYLKMNDHHYIYAQDGVLLTGGLSTKSDTCRYDCTNRIVVNMSTENNTPEDGFVTLREALNLAHAGGTSDTGEIIDKNQDVKIDVTSLKNTLELQSRLPAIDKNIAISGSPLAPFTIDGMNQHRIFFGRKGFLSLSNLILQKGRAKGGNGSDEKTPGGGGAGMGGALFVNRNSRVKCKNVQFLENTAQGGNGGKTSTSSPYFCGAGGGFYGDANLYAGGSGGYLGNEGKGGDSSTGRRHHGRFGGGGGNYWDYPGIIYGGNGGFGGGAGSGSKSSSKGAAGAFGGYAVNTSTYNHAGGGAGLGGAVFVREYGQFIALSCSFSSNKANGGSGSRSYYYSGGSGQGKAGAIFVHNEKAVVCLEDCSFSGNSAQNSSSHYVSGFEFQDNNDIYGAYSPIVPLVNYVKLEYFPPLNDTEISYLVQFDVEVKGVDKSDFDIDTDNRGDTRIASVKALDAVSIYSSSARTYRVTVSHSRSAGIVTLKIIDNDSIRDTVRNNPLGYYGKGNGDFIGETCHFFPAVQVPSILPLSGSFQVYGANIRNGIELALAGRTINDASTRAGISSNSFDNGSDTNTVDALIAEAAGNENVLALLGGATSNVTVRMAEQCVTNQIPLFSPTSTTTRLSDYDYTVNLVPLDNYQVDAVHEVLIDFASNEFFLIFEDTLYGRSFSNLGLEEGLVMTGRYRFTSNSLIVDEILPLLTQSFQTNNPAIVMAVYEDDANLLLKTFSESGNASIRNATVILTDAAATEKALEGLPEDHSLSLFGLNPIIPETTTAKQFKNQYITTYGSEPEWVSYYGYDTVQAFSTAINRISLQDEITRQRIWEAVPWMRFEGVSGTKTFDEKGNLYSAAYDLHIVKNGAWAKADTIHVFKPEDDPAPGLAKVASRNLQPLNASIDFTYTLEAADPLISHLAGEQAQGTGWLAESLDAPLGGVLMAYYEDIGRGLSDSEEEFVFEDGRTYYLNFNVLRVDQFEDSPAEGNVLEITVKSVYRYQNGDAVTHFARKELLRETVGLSDWPPETSKQITLPVTYQSAAPDGLSINNEDNRFHWELKLLNAARQKVLLTSVEIGTGEPTAVEDYMLH